MFLSLSLSIYFYFLKAFSYFAFDVECRSDPSEFCHSYNSIFPFSNFLLLLDFPPLFDSLLLLFLFPLSDSHFSFFSIPPQSNILLLFSKFFKKYISVFFFFFFSFYHLCFYKSPSSFFSLLHPNSLSFCFCFFCCHRDWHILMIVLNIHTPNCCQTDMRRYWFITNHYGHDWSTCRNLMISRFPLS